MIGATDQPTVNLHLQQSEALLLLHYLDRCVASASNAPLQQRDLAQFVSDGLSLARWMREDVALSMTWAEADHLYHLLPLGGEEDPGVQPIRQCLHEMLGTTATSAKVIMEAADELCVLTG